MKNGYIIDEYIIRETIEALYQAKTAILGITGLDSEKEVARKCIENECATTRRIDMSIDMLQQGRRVSEETLTEKKFKECLANVPDYDRCYTAGVMDTLAKLPSEEEVWDKSWELAHQKSCAHSSLYPAYRDGFTMCYDWLKSQLTKEE